MNSLPTHTRRLFILDSILSYAVGCWKAGVRLTAADHIARESPEAQPGVDEVITQVNSAVSGIPDILFEHKNRLNRTAHETADTYGVEPVDEIADLHSLLDEAVVLSVRAAAIHEALLVVPPDYPERKHLEAGVRDATKALNRARKSLSKVNERFPEPTRRALIALASVEHGVSIKEAEEIIDARWQ